MGPDPGALSSRWPWTTILLAGDLADCPERGVAWHLGTAMLQMSSSSSRLAQGTTRRALGLQTPCSAEWGKLRSWQISDFLRVTELIIIIIRLEPGHLQCDLKSFSKSSELKGVYVLLGCSQLIWHHVCVDSLEALLPELSCVWKKNFVHEHLAYRSLICLHLVIRLLYADDLVIEFQILQNLKNVHKSGGYTRIPSTAQPLSPVLTVFLFHSFGLCPGNSEKLSPVAESQMSHATWFLKQKYILKLS